MSKPIVAVVGRPNVGKSTLFNHLAGQQISIVKDTPGVTRDRIYAEVSWLDKNFTLIDTGGIEPETKDIILAQMREQAQIAIDTADVIIFITDVRQGLVDADAKVADMLRRSHKPVVLVVNKVDNFEKLMPDVYEFYNLGIGDPVPISAVGKLGIGEMLDEVVKHFPEDTQADEEDDRPKIAIVGKPNVGKSSIINKMVGEQRVIVSDIAGTTRDTLEESIQIKGIPLNIIDTAGIRDTNDLIEKIGVDKAKDLLTKADLVLYVVDTSDPLTKDDEEIMELIEDKQTIVLLNKADLDQVVKVSDLKEKGFEQIVQISAKEQTGIEELYQLIQDIFFEGHVSFNDEIYLTNMRHKTEVSEALKSLAMVLQSIEDGMPEDFFSIDLLDAYEHLGFITGESVGEDLVNEIFAEFCMGK